jgi:NAD(P)-dependent dehydrogenase (short-subunit alcohol dehydrogenase family)
MGVKNSFIRGLRYIVKGVPVINISAKVYQIEHGNTLIGKNIIVTGASKGIGYAIAKKCTSEGANVIITGRNEKALEEAKEKLGIRCKYLVSDVRDINKMDTFLSNATKLVNGEKIDCLVSNAGVSLHEKDYSMVTVDSWDEQMDTNLKGTYFLIQAFVKQLQRFNGGGNILIVSSERGLYCDDTPYGLSKTALNSLTQGLSRRLITQGIRVNAIAPGVTASEMTGYKSDENLYRESACGKRVFLPEEIAEVAAFLLNDASQCISGEIIACDQGNYLRSDW